MNNLQMKKLLASTIAAAAMIASVPSAQAASVISSFNVDITLTSACSVSTPGNLTFAYTALQAVPATATSPFSVTCASGLPYTVGVSGASVTDNAVGLAYSLAITAPVGGGVGTGSSQLYSIDGTIASGQAGSCVSATCVNTAATNKAKTVTVTY